MVDTLTYVHFILVKERSYLINFISTDLIISSELNGSEFAVAATNQTRQRDLLCLLIGRSLGELGRFTDEMRSDEMR